MEHRQTIRKHKHRRLYVPYSVFCAQRGTTFIDALVGTALMLVVFIGLFGVIRLATLSVGLAKAKTGAIALANEQIEYVRSLPYNSVAVLGGIPAGLIPAEETIPLNNIAYTRRTFVQFIDSPADGVGASDQNLIQADYKVAKVDVSWVFRDTTRTVSLITNIVPKGIETLDGGGTLVVNVIDAGGVPVSGAGITIMNTAVSPTINVSTFSGVDGVAYFPGAPTSTAYFIQTTKAGYSSAQTYYASSTNPNPNPGTLTVVADTITSSTFRIDRLSDLSVRSFDEVRTATWTDPFDDASLIENLTNTSVSGGGVRLTDLGGTYPSAGSLTATSVAPVYLNAWKRAVFDDTTPASTSVAVQVRYRDGASAPLIPDAVLPGNTVGFTTSPIDLSGVATTTYSALILSADLTTNDTLVTPVLDTWSVVYDEGPLPRADVDFTIVGSKTIGTDGGGAPIYKYQSTFSTDALGVMELSDMEWDTYTVAKASGETTISVAEVCPFQPFGLNPGVTQVLDFIFAPASTHSLLVYVTDDTGTPLPDASVRAVRTGYDVTHETSACGQAFFRSLVSGVYDLTVSATGFTTQALPGVSVTGATTQSVILNP